MQPFIAEKREEIAELCRKHHVRRLSIFGSAVRDDFDPATSDVDVIVEFDEVPATAYFDNKSELWNALVYILERKVDLITWKSIRSKALLGSVQQDEEMLYAA